MAGRREYAEDTKVSVGQSKADIEKLVNRYGADGFGIMSMNGLAQIAFRVNNRNILFKMSIPEGAQKERAIWRAMLLTIKAKFESAARGIETFEDAFLANIVMPNGQTVSEATRPAIAQQYAGKANVPLLPQM